MNNAGKAGCKDTEIEQLVRQSQRGCRRAFDELVRIYQKPAMNLAVRITGNRDHGSEVVQDSFIKAYFKIGKLKDARQFKLWLFKIIINGSLDQLKAIKKRRENIIISDGDINSKSGDPAEKAQVRELRYAIERSMTKLSAREAKAIALFGLEDMSQKQVAEIMGCSKEAVRFHVFKARKKLKQLLKDYL